MTRTFTCSSPFARDPVAFVDGDGTFGVKLQKQ